MDGGNAENAGAFFGHGASRSHQSDTTTPAESLYQSKYWKEWNSMARIFQTLRF